ncbi:MAG: tripartite tricarboxylate transporter substrate binding protein, partial [Comamonas sp.]
MNSSTSSTSSRLSRRGLLMCAAALACPLGAPLAHAESVYPAKPVTLLVPYPAGGANDAVARLIGLKM